MLDAVLFILVGILAVGMTVMGGVLASQHPRWRRAFIAMGVASVGLLVWQGIRVQTAQQNLTDQVTVAASETRAAHNDTRLARKEASAEREESRREREESRREREEARQARRDEKAAEQKLQRLVDQRAKETVKFVGQFASDTNTAVGKLLQAPRSLTSDQRERLASLLKPTERPVRVAVGHAAGDMESQNYADEFVEVFKTAGWTVEDTRMLITTHEGEGLWILVRDVKKPPPAALVLQRGLAEFGLEARGVAVAGLADNEIELYVGVQKKKVK